LDVSVSTTRAGPRPTAAASPPVDEFVPLPTGRVLIGRFPVTNSQARPFVHEPAPDLAARLASPVLADHPVTGLTLTQARAFCAGVSEALGYRVRLPTGDEWEALARGEDGREWPWGDVFSPDLCNCAEAGWGTTVPVDAHPKGASAAGAEQMAGNVWEWVEGDAGDGWVYVRGGCYLDHAWGVRASRALPADPRRATTTTGFRIATDDPRRCP
jgi:formylglycine-generating enzyme required for sulfatase activity